MDSRRRGIKGWWNRGTGKRMATRTAHEGKVLGGEMRNWGAEQRPSERVREKCLDVERDRGKQGRKGWSLERGREG